MQVERAEATMCDATGDRFADERPEADALEQQRAAVLDPEDANDPEAPVDSDARRRTEQAVEPGSGELPLEADPADVVEQRRVIPEPDEDHLH
jgi:hypothetical protein